MPEIRKIQQLDTEALRPLLETSIAEGYDFVQRLQDEYLSGKNDFSTPGSVLLGVYEQGKMIGIGGVHPDNYLNDPQIGRIRRIYILPEHRRGGTGSQLMRTLIEAAKGHFKVLTLRTWTEHGDAFYKSLGFHADNRYENASHWMALDESKQG